MTEKIYKGFVEYQSKIKALKISKEELVVENPNIEKTTIETNEKGHLILKFETIGIPDPDEAINQTKQLADDILNKLAFQYELAIATPQYSVSISEETFFENGIKAVTIKHTALSIGGGVGGGSAVVSYSHCHGAINKIIKEIDKNKSQHLKDYREALQISDNIGRFIALYKIGLHIFDDNQKDLDEFIRKEEPNVPQSKRPGKLYNETVYSRLRNEINHPRIGTTIEATSKEIQERVNPFLGLIKKAIQQNTK